MTYLQPFLFLSLFSHQKIVYVAICGLVCLLLLLIVIVGVFAS